MGGTHLQVLLIISPRSRTSACVTGSQFNKKEPGEKGIWAWRVRAENEAFSSAEELEMLTFIVILG